MPNKQVKVKKFRLEILGGSNNNLDDLKGRKFYCVLEYEDENFVSSFGSTTTWRTKDASAAGKGKVAGIEFNEVGLLPSDTEQFRVILLKKVKLGSNKEIAQTPIQFPKLPIGSKTKSSFVLHCTDFHAEVLITMKEALDKSETEAMFKARHKNLMMKPRSQYGCEEKKVEDEPPDLAEEVQKEPVAATSSYMEETEDYSMYHYSGDMKNAYGIQSTVPSHTLTTPTPVPSAEAPKIINKESTEGEDLANFNLRFQKLSQDILQFELENSSLSSRINTQMELMHLVEDFLYAARIISERCLPVETKTIKPAAQIGGLVGGDKYIVHNILFKFAVDSHGFFGSDTWAAKVAGLELKGLMAYHNSGVLGLHLPLECLIDYRGYRLLAVALLPVDNTTLRVGSSDAGKTIHNDDAQLISKLKAAAALLNIKPHKFRGRTFYSAIDLEGHLGTDGRHYLLDFSRVFPPETPNPNFKNGHLYRLLRPEFLKKYPKPLCSDGFSGFIKKENAEEHNKELEEATKFLIEVEIPKFTKDFDALLESIVVGKATVDSCQNTTRIMHEWGLNMRYLGKVYTNLKANETKLVALIEMCARIIKTKLRQTIRNKMEELKFPLEQPYRALTLQFLNSVICDSAVDTTWKGFIQSELVSYYGMEEMDGADVRRQIFNTKGGALLLFTRLVRMTGLHFNSRVFEKIKKNSGSFRENFLSHNDLLDLGERVKHMDMVSQAQAFIWTQEAMVCEDPTEREALYQMAMEKYKEALNSDPTNRVSLLGLGNSIVHYTQAKGGDPNVSKLGLSIQDPQVRKAKQWYKRCLIAHGKNSSALFQYGEFLEICQRFEKASEYYLRSVEADPRNTMAVFRYAQYLKSTHHEDATKMFEWMNS